MSSWELTWLILAGVGLKDQVVKPHVCYSHAVLRQRAGLVRADRWRRPESFYSFEILHQTVLARHTFGRQSQTNLDHMTVIAVTIVTFNSIIISSFNVIIIDNPVKSVSFTVKCDC